MKYDLQSDSLPIINGILYADGKIEHLCISCDENHRRYIEKGSVIEEEIYESSVGISAKCQSVELDLKVSVGEGSFGGDGFVFAQTLSSDSFLWLIAFDDSNPFIAVRIADDKILVENNLYEVWEINIKEITNPQIAIIKQSKFLC